MSSGSDRQAEATEPDQADSVIMLIRHAEKPLHSGAPHGVTGDGVPDPHSLTVHGWLRAGALPEFFAPSRGAPPAGLPRPDAVYGSGFDSGGHSKRSIQTVTPLAARLGLEVVNRFAHGDEANLAEELTERGGVAVVSWHHEAIHRIVSHLGEVTPTPPRHWPADRFDLVWVFSRYAVGWRFAQVPQMLLPGDWPHPISD